MVVQALQFFEKRMIKAASVEFEEVKSSDVVMTGLLRKYTAQARKSTQDAVQEYKIWQEQYLAERKPEVLDLEAREGILLGDLVRLRFEHYRILNASLVRLCRQDV